MSTQSSGLLILSPCNGSMGFPLSLSSCSCTLILPRTGLLQITGVCPDSAAVTTYPGPNAAFYAPFHSPTSLDHRVVRTNGVISFVIAVATAVFATRDVTQWVVSHCSALPAIAYLSGYSSFVAHLALAKTKGLPLCIEIVAQVITVALTYSLASHTPFTVCSFIHSFPANVQRLYRALLAEAATPVFVST